MVQLSSSYRKLIDEGLDLPVRNPKLTMGVPYPLLDAK